MKWVYDRLEEKVLPDENDGEHPDGGQGDWGHVGRVLRGFLDRNSDGLHSDACVGRYVGPVVFAEAEAGQTLAWAVVRQNDDVDVKWLDKLGPEKKDLTFNAMLVCHLKALKRKT